MDIELLRTFLAITRTRHFGRAAEQLFITPAAVSARIRQLEQLLGVSLLHRTRGNIQMTAAGERLLPHAQKLLANWAAAQEELTLNAQGLSPFRLGYAPCLGRLLHDWLLDFRHRPLRLVQGSAASLLQALHQARLDALLLPDTGPEPGLITQPLVRLELVRVIADRDAEPCWLELDWGRRLPPPASWQNAQALSGADWSVIQHLLAHRRTAAWLPDSWLPGLPVTPDPSSTTRESLAICLVYAPGQESTPEVQALCQRADKKPSE